MGYVVPLIPLRAKSKVVKELITNYGAIFLGVGGKYVLFHLLKILISIKGTHASTSQIGSRNFESCHDPRDPT